MNMYYRIGLIALVLAIGAGAYFLRAPDERPRTGAGSVTHWKALIESKGAEAAYEELARAIADDTPTERHAAAHQFGEAMYAIEGKRAIRICDQRFSYGCFHQVLGQAIAEDGLGVVGELNQACIDSLSAYSPLSCQHGLGHGIQAFLGYEEADLPHGLDVCRELRNDRIGGCYSGIFMEFNLRTLWGESSVPREIDRAAAAATCDALAAEYRPACLYWSPQWWLQAIFGAKASPDDFTVVGGICAKAARTDDERKDCFEGIGTMAPQKADFDIAGTIARCEAVSKHGLERLYCRASAANILAADVDRSAAEASCGGLAGIAHEYCIAYARNELNVFNRARLIEAGL